MCSACEHKRKWFLLSSPKGVLRSMNTHMMVKGPWAGICQRGRQIRTRYSLKNWWKSHVSCSVTFALSGSRPEKNMRNLTWSPNVRKLWGRATQLDYAELRRHRIWHLLNTLRCLVTVSEALKNFPLWESPLVGHPPLLNKKFFTNAKVKNCPEPDWWRTER